MEHDRVVGRVGREHRHLVALADPPLRERGRDLGDHAVQLAVGQLRAGAPVDERHPVCSVSQVGEQELVQGDVGDLHVGVRAGDRHRCAPSRAGLVTGDPKVSDGRSRQCPTSTQIGARDLLRPPRSSGIVSAPGFRPAARRPAAAGSRSAPRRMREPPGRAAPADARSERRERAGWPEHVTPRRPGHPASSAGTDRQAACASGSPGARRRPGSPATPRARPARPTPGGWSRRSRARAAC